MRLRDWFRWLFCLIFTVSLLNARVVRVEIASRQDVSNGREFGDVGAYERITGRVFFSVLVTNPHNRGIVDLDNAVSLNDGAVEFSADFMALRPKVSAKSNGSLLLEIPNRGRGRIVSLVDGGDWDAAKDAGDGWLLRNGYSVADNSVTDKQTLAYANLAFSGWATLTRSTSLLYIGCNLKGPWNTTVLNTQYQTITATQANVTRSAGSVVNGSD